MAAAASGAGGDLPGDPAGHGRHRDGDTGRAQRVADPGLGAAGTTWVFPLTLKGLTASLDGGSVDLTDARGRSWG